MLKTKDEYNRSLLWESRVNRFAFELSNPDVTHREYSNKKEELKDFIRQEIKQQKLQLLEEIREIIRDPNIQTEFEGNHEDFIRFTDLQEELKKLKETI